MEQKPQLHPQTQTHHYSQKSSKNNLEKLLNFKPTNNHNTTSKPIWDCGSTLYDSFELNSFQKQLDSAIINSSRTLSMPRLPSEDRRAPPPPPPSKKPVTSTSKISRSFQKLLRSVFRASKPNHSKPGYDSSSPDPWFLDHEVQEKGKVVDGGRYFVVYEKPNGLSSIPEVTEISYSPEISSLVRKTMSDRFTAPLDGIYCN